VKLKIAIGLLIVVIAVVALSLRDNTAFNNPHAFLSRSPTNAQWAADFIVERDFRSMSYDFRVHDRAVSPRKPFRVGDLYWESRYSPGNLLWSRDGTIAAASIFRDGSQVEVLACAYDFVTHQALRTPLNPPSDDTQQESIRHLLDAHGGYTKTPLPSFKEL
jgi:hypothetical protein